MAVLCDGSMATKMTVQFNLFGGTVFKLGIAKEVVCAEYLVVSSRTLS